jgi:hypothetical protein
MMRMEVEGRENSALRSEDTQEVCPESASRGCYDQDEFALISKHL